MHLSSLMLILSASFASALALSLDSQHLFTNPPDSHNADYHIPSVHESAVMARRILHLSTLGTLVTSFPTTHSKEEEAALENRPSSVEDNPIGLMEYYADCEADGNPTLLAINIATPYKNYGAGSNISLSVRWWPNHSNTYFPYLSTNNDDDDDDFPTPHTPAALPRFSLHGHLESIPALELINKMIPPCFLKAHPDSILWQPGNDIHESEYVRFVVEHVYWFGGFGDRARIGWLPVGDYLNVTMDEVSKIRLPGEATEKGGWKEGL